MRAVAQQQTGSCTNSMRCASLSLVQFDRFHPIVLKGLGELVEVAQSIRW